MNDLFSHLPASDDQYPIEQSDDSDERGSGIVLPGLHSIEKIKEIAKGLVPHAIPIYCPDDQNRAEGFGSGFLLGIGEKTFLVTAAHVLDENEERALYVAGENDELVQLQNLEIGDTHRSVVPTDGSREDDILDIGYVQLNSEEISSEFEPISIRRADPNEGPNDSSRYLLLGFPATKNEPRGARQVKRSITSYSAEPVERETYEKHGLEPVFHITLQFDPKETYMPKRLKQGHGPLSKPPDFHGMSGGPIWCLSAKTILEGNPSGARLVGLCSELLYVDKTIYGPRIGIVLEAIRETHAELSRLIPETHIGDITVQRKERRPPEGE